MRSTKQSLTALYNILARRLALRALESSRVTTRALCRLEVCGVYSVEVIKCDQ